MDNTENTQPELTGEYSDIVPENGIQYQIYVYRERSAEEVQLLIVTSDGGYDYDPKFHQK